MTIPYDELERLPAELATDDLILFAITELDAVVVLLPAEPDPDEGQVQP